MEENNTTKRMAFMNFKGGVGKSTITHNVCVGLSMRGKKILAVDMDPQASLTENVGLDPDDDKQNTVHGLLFNNLKWQDCVINIREGLDVIPSNSFSMCQSDRLIFSTRNGEGLLYRALNKIKDGTYDYIIVDCPGTLGIHADVVCSAVNSVYVVTEPKNHAGRGLGLIEAFLDNIKQICNKDLELMGIIVNLYRNGIRSHDDIYGKIKHTFGELVFNDYIRLADDISTAPCGFQSVLEAKNIKKDIKDSFNRVIDEIVKREKTKGCDKKINIKEVVNG